MREQPARSGAYVWREFTLVEVEAAATERRVTQLQYVRWPDHGVPEGATSEHSDLVDFFRQVRQLRYGHLEPLVVHCSAGIGRTGVLILLETIATLIEQRRPLNLLFYVLQMRAQRALLIQTREQFLLCCELALRFADQPALLVRPRPRLMLILVLYSYSYTRT